MATDESRGSEGVRRLATLRFEGDEYFIDNRLREFRTVTPPMRMIEFIRFESAKGRQMLACCGCLTCRHCGRTFAIDRRHASSETWCPGCRQAVGIPEQCRRDHEAAM